jgi:transcriptional regulator with XRE-family HTH domain
MMTGLILLDFNEWIVEQRLQKRLDAKECAKTAGVTPQAWSEWETGRSRRKDERPPQPRRDTVRKVALGLGVPLRDALMAAGYAPDTETLEPFLDDLSPDLQTVHALQGKAFQSLPPGKARERYLAQLRANAELIIDMETRLDGRLRE